VCRIAAKHELPVILDIYKGKQLVLNLVGHTLDTELLLTLPSVHTLSPQPIGLTEDAACVQLCCVGNECFLPLVYEIECDAIEQVCVCV